MGRQSDDSPDVTPVGPQNDQTFKYIVSLNGTTFDGSVDTVPRVIIHSLIHAGGIGGKNDLIEHKTYIPSGNIGPGNFITTLRPPKHDLEWMNYGKNKDGKYSEDSYIGVYDDIMEKSTPK